MVQPMATPAGAQSMPQVLVRQVPTEDWYQDGGPKNRIVLALDSGLPNEVDWAFNLLVKLSAVCPEHYSLAFIPPLTDAILEHAVPFFRWVDSQRQDLALRLGRPVVALPAVPLNGMFHALPGFSPEQLERTMQVYHIFRNFSFLEANMKILLNHPAIVQLVEYGLIIAGEALPTTEIKRYALDIYENTSREIRVRSADDRLFVEIMRLLYSDDRAMVVGSVRSLTNLCTYSLNEELFSTVNVPMVERMLQLLLAGDEQVVSAVMEFLYQYTRLYEKAAQRIAEISKTNVVRLLSKFLGWKGRPRPANQPAPAPTPLAANVMTAPPSVIARGGLPPTVNRPQEQSSAPSQTSTAVDTFRKSATAEQMHCMNWLDRNYELSDGHTLIQTEWYGLYTKEAKLAGRAKQTIPMTEFLRIAKTLYGNKLAVTTAKDSTGKDQLAMCGLRRRAGTTPAGSDAEKEDDDEEEAGSEDDDDSDGSAGDNDESGEDEAGNESDEEQSEAAGEEQDGAVGEEQSVAGDKVDGDVDEDQDSSMQVDVQEAAAAGDNGEQRMDDVPAEVPEEMLTAQMEGVKEGSPVNATSPQRPVVSACKWHGCSAVLPHPCGPTELSRHIGVAHFAPRPVYECHWLGCKDFQPTASRTQAINHFRRHVPHIFPKVLPLNVLAATHATHPNAPLYPAPIVASKDMIGLSSIPFTAALVLRNLARAKNNRSLFWSFESDFAYAMALQSANEGMAKVLGSILYELAAKDAAEKQQEQDKEGGGEVRDGVQR